METDETSRVKIEKLELGEGETVQWENSSGKREMEGRKNRTDVEIEKEFWARIPGICGEGGGSLFIITVFRVLNVGKGSNA